MNDTLELFCLTLGLVDTNAYILGDSATGEAILIDPVDEADTLIGAAADARLNIRLIVATHAHFDHVLASAALKEKTGAPFIVHQEAAPLLRNVPQQGVRFFGTPFPPAAVPDQLITNDSEWIELGALRLQPLYTPGHAPGHIALFLPSHRLLFSGDTLFAGTVGRWDLPGGNQQVLLASITNKLLPLGDDVRVLPGHGEPTTIGIERRENPYLQW
ncbi:MAG: MBL fold metallo-hydrolase [Anaerolineae bacterium]